MLIKTIKMFFYFSLVLFFEINIAHAEINETVFYKPFVLAQIVKSTDTKSISSKVEKTLKKWRFEIVGKYSPYPNTFIIVISNKALQKAASLTTNGIYAAIQRVTITTVGNETQVSFTNPSYMAHAYRLKADLSSTTERLKRILGFTKYYGSDKGLSKASLRNYYYKWIMMPDFTDRLELAEYPNQKTALKEVLAALQNNDAGVSKVYRLDLRGRNETIIGVQMKGTPYNDCSSDKFIMGKVDSKHLKSTGHLPYELIIKNGVVNALFAEFRIALNFPDLSMTGENSFTTIMCAPGSILEALTLAAGGNPDESW